MVRFTVTASPEPGSPAQRRSRRASAMMPIVRRMNVLLRATADHPRTMFPPRADEAGIALPVPMLDTGSRERAALGCAVCSCAIAMVLVIALLATAVACYGSSGLLP
jgi:hypothetical protein